MDASGIRNLITMKLRILGTGTATPSLERSSSSYLLETGWGQILIDIGPSVVRRLLECGCTTNDVDMIVLTHFHPDHTIDLATFLFASNYGDVTRQKPLRLLGGRGIDRFFRKYVRLYRWLAPVGYELSVTSLPSGTLSLESVVIRTTRAHHNPESIALRIEEERSIVFTGDTAYSRHLMDLANQADVLVAECSFPERKVSGHLNLATLQRIVSQAKPRQVLLSHLYPEWTGFRRALPPPLLLAFDGLEIEV
jgi:ribonuclease BN (tRNA processing enzyme)